MNLLALKIQKINEETSVEETGNAVSAQRLRVTGNDSPNL